MDKYFSISVYSTEKGRFATIFEDITKRKKAEIAISESEVKYRELAELLPQMVFELDPEFRITYANRHMLTMLGLTSQDIAGGVNSLSFIDPSQHAQLREIVQKQLRGETYDPREYTILRKDGSTFPVIIYSSPVFRDNQLSGFRGVIVDISARKKMEDELRQRNEELHAAFEQVTATEEELRENYDELRRHEDVLRDSEEKFRALVEHSLDGILISDFTGTLLFANHAVRRIVDIGQDEEIIGKASVLDYVAPEYRNDVLRDFQKIASGIDTYLVQYRIITAAKEEKWVECIGKKIRFGDVSAILVSLRDVTGRKKAEELVRESEAKFSTVFRSSPVTLTLVSATDGTFVDVNDAFVKNTGYLREEVIGKTAEQLQIFLNDGERGELKTALRNNKEIRGTEITCRTRAGENRACLFSSRLILMQGKPYVLSTIEDITERKKAEEALKESERRYRNLYQYALVGLFETSLKDAAVVACNQRYCDLFGFSSVEDAMGKDVLHLYENPDDRNEVSRILREQGFLSNHEVRFINQRTGKPFWAQFSARINRDMDVAEGTIIDITDRKTAEALLRESQRTLSTLMGNLPGMAYRCLNDETWTMEFVSQGCEDLTGYNASDLTMNRTVAYADLIHPDDRQIVRDTVQDALENRRKFQILYRILTKSGDEKWVSEQGLGVFSPSGDLLAIEGFIRDITERRKAEEALKESEDKYRRISENAPDMVYRMSLPGGRYEYVSPVSAELTGYTPEEFYADPSLIWRLVHPDWRKYLEEQMAGLLKGNLPPSYEFQIIDRPGRTRWVNQRNMLVRNEHGEPVAIEGIVTDITRQKETERELKRSELRFLAVSENAGSWIWEIDAEGVYRYSSPAVMRILGYRPDELVGKMHFYDLFDPAGREDQKTAMLAIYARQEPFYGSVNLSRHKTGAPVLLNSSGAPAFDEAGRFSGYCGVDEDITEQKRALEALRESEAKYRLLADNVHDVIWTAGLDMHLTYISPSVMELRGLTPEEAMAETIRDALTPASYEVIMQAREQGMRKLQGDPPASGGRVLELEFYRKDGSTVWTETAIALAFDSSRRPAGVVGVMRDITQRKQVEDALRKSRQLLGEAMDLAHLVNWEYDLASGMFTFDDRFYALYGTTAEREGGYLMPAEVYAREFVYPDDRHLVGEEVERAETTTDPHYSARLEHRIIRRDGEIRHIIVRVEITKDADGRTIKTHGANQDITDIRKAEEALQESEEKFRSLVETSPGMIWEIDPRGVFRYISPMVQTILGYAPEEITGKTIADLIPEESRSSIMQELARHLSSEGPIPPFEVPARHRNGRDMMIEIRPSRIIGTDSRLAGLRGVAYDITERKRAEEALQLANRQLNLLGSITRHDLLNKITVILGNLKLAEKKCTDPGLMEHLAKIRSATGAIKSQIEFTRIYQKLGTHEPQWIAIESVMPTSHVPPGITLDAEVRGISVLADPMLERVFFNLLDNSIRHGQQVTAIRVFTEPSGSDLVMFWEDNGIGIPDDEKEKIFEREFGANTGLGMFLAREILSLTGITIRETGEPGRGARFEITVPKGAYQAGTHSRNG